MIGKSLIIIEDGEEEKIILGGDVFFGKNGIELLEFVDMMMVEVEGMIVDDVGNVLC